MATRPRATSGASILDLEGNVLLVFDATTEEDENNEADVTEFSVEDGADFTDHVRQKPTDIKATCFFTNAPRVAGAFDSLTRDYDLFAELKRLQRDVGPYIIQLGLETLAPAVIKSCRGSRRANLGQAVEVTATFQQINTVTAQSVLLPPVQRIRAAEEDDASDTEDQDRQEGAEPSESTLESSADRLVDAITGREGPIQGLVDNLRDIVGGGG